MFSSNVFFGGLVAVLVFVAVHTLSLVVESRSHSRGALQHAEASQTGD